MTQKILVINGPNLNLLGTRETHIYGSTTLADVETNVKKHAEELGASVEFFQSNHEGAIIDRIHKARGDIDAIIINPAAYTHTSVGLRDALLAVSIPFVEIHITNTHTREQFRHHSYLTDKADAFVMGMGVFGYHAAIEFAAKHMKGKE